MRALSEGKDPAHRSVKQNPLFRKRTKVLRSEKKKEIHPDAGEELKKPETFYRPERTCA